jgi:hypothetical protein
VASKCGARDATFLFDAATVIAHNHASDSNDNGFGC